MPQPPKLTESQKEQLAVLEPELRDAVNLGDYEAAKRITARIQRLLRPTGHETRLMKAKAWLFEAAMEAGNLQIAAVGLQGIRQKTSRQTRIHLEATALLAICLLRQNQVERAEPLIAEVLRGDKYIRSERQRRTFRLEIKQRFEQEGALAVLRGVGEERLVPAEIEDEAGRLVRTSTEDEILATLGSQLPEQVVRRLLNLDEIARRALPEADLKYLPKPREIVEEGAVGRTVYGAFRTVLYRSLCDPESDIYKVWVHQGLGVVLDKKYIGIAIAAVMSNLGIGIKGLAVSAAALLLKFGIEVFCEKSRPREIMSIKAGDGV